MARRGGDAPARADDPIEAVSFDLDNTLCRYDRPPAAILERAFAAAGVGALFTLDDYVRAFDELAGEVPDMPTLRRRAFERLATDAGHDPETGRAIARAYTEHRDPSAVAWRGGMERVFERFRADYAVVIVTNGLPGAQRAKLDRLGVAGRVDAVVFGDGTVPRKPAPEPFRTALEAVGTPPRRAVHVGDSLGHDVAGANAAGLTSVWFPDPAWTVDAAGEAAVAPDHRVAGAAELLDRPWTR